MNIEDMLDINDCPLCDGGALLEEECGCGYYVMCMECGCHSVTIDFHSEEERLDAAKRTVMLWNTGKERLFYHKKIIDNIMNKLIILSIIFLWLNCYTLYYKM